MRIAAVCGSLRADSYNRKLLALALPLVRKLNAETDELDLREFPLPLFDADIESAHGLPDVVWKLKARLAACQGVLIACPEYNSGIPGGFKNMLDWTSRGASQPWAEKVVALMGATTGLWGTQRMMPHLRQTLGGLGAHVISPQINVREAANVWDANSVLLDERLPPRLETFIGQFLTTVEKLKQIDA